MSLIDKQQLENKTSRRNYDIIITIIIILVASIVSIYFMVSFIFRNQISIDVILINIKTH